MVELVYTLVLETSAYGIVSSTLTGATQVAGNDTALMVAYKLVTAFTWCMNPNGAGVACEVTGRRFDSVRTPLYGSMVEMVDTQDSKPCACGRFGSTPNTATPATFGGDKSWQS